MFYTLKASKDVYNLDDTNCLLQELQNGRETLKRQKKRR